MARWSLKLQSFDFDIIHRKGCLNTVPDSLSRIYMEEITTGLLQDLDLKNEAFQNPSYLDLIATVQKYKDSLPDLKTSDGVVYKRTEFRSGSVNEDETWKI